MNQNAIEIRGLGKTFFNFKLDNVSFDVPSGRIVGFIGENGAGKSTTINLILNEFKRDSGNIKLFGMDNINNEIQIKEKIGVVFDECNFHEMLNADDIEKILRGVYSTWNSGLFDNYLKRFKLSRKQKIGSFSKGMKMKLAIIAALSHDPQLLILDEATTGLDPIVREEILDIFLEYMQNEKCSILFSSHITNDIEKIADYVVLIHNGKIVFSEQKDELLYNYGILKCGLETFKSIDKNDYISYKANHYNYECLIKDRALMKKKYKEAIVDNATLEDIMLFYIKGDSKCAE